MANELTQRKCRPEEAKRLLTKLANDPAIRHVMAEHKFTVGLLTELAPHEHPELLGLNEVRPFAVVANHKI